MKHLFFTIPLLIGIAYSQCFSVPPCDEVEIFGNIDSVAYTGDKVFSGNGLIGNKVTFDNWNVLAFKGTLAVRPTINCGDSARLYASGTVSFKKLVFNNVDTLFLNSYTVVESLVNNGAGSVIVLPVHIPYILIGLTPVQAGTSYKGVKIIQCGSILPITASRLSIQRVDKSTFRLNVELNETMGDRAKVIRVLRNGKEVWRISTNGETTISEIFKLN